MLFEKLMHDEIKKITSMSCICINKNNVKWMFLYVKILKSYSDESTIDAFLATLKFSAELFSELVWIITFKFL